MKDEIIIIDESEGQKYPTLVNFAIYHKIRYYTSIKEFLEENKK